MYAPQFDVSYGLQLQVWRPHDGHACRLRRSSSPFFASPACIISHAAAEARVITSAASGSSIMSFLRRFPPRVWVRAEVQLPAALIGYVRVQLGCRQIRVAEHLLNAPEVGAVLEQMRRERVPQEVRVDAFGLEPGLCRETPEDEERAGPRERAALCVQEQLRSMAAVEVRPAARGVAPERLRCLAPDRNDALFAALAHDAHETVVEVDRAALEADRLRYAEAGAVQELDEGAVAQRARSDTRCGVDQPFGLTGRERLRQAPRAAGQRDVGRRVVLPLAEQLEVAVERSRGGDAPGDRCGRQSRRPEARDVLLEIVRRRRRERPLEERLQSDEVPLIPVDISVPRHARGVRPARRIASPAEIATSACARTTTPIAIPV